MKRKHGSRFAVTAGLVALAIGGVTACSSSGASGGGSSSSSSAKGRALTIAMAIEPSSLDPCDTSNSDGVGVIRGNVVESLTDIDADTGKVIPLLATSWTHDSPTTWTFKLRQGVTYQDGSVFDASAAAFGITRTLNKKLNCMNIQDFPDPVTASVVDASTLRLTTPKPDPILPLRVSYADLVSPKTSMDSKSSSPVGTGPYKFDSRQAGQSLKIVRWEGYWGTKPAATSVTYIYRSEDSVRAATVKTGEADIAMQIAPQDATTDDRTRQFTQNRVFFLRTQTKKPPFTDIRVRQAVAYAINKEKIVGSLMDKVGKPADQLVTKSVNGFIPGYTAPVYDPNKAKSLLAEARAAGVDTSVPIKFVSRNVVFPGSVDVIQAIVQNLKEVGFNIQLLSLDTVAWNEYWRGPFPADQQVNIVVGSHDNVSGDGTFTFPNNIGNGCCSTVGDPKVDSLIAQADVAEGSERASLYQQAAKQEYVHDAAIIPVAELFSLLQLGKGVEYQPNGLTGLQLHIADVHFTS